MLALTAPDVERYVTFSSKWQPIYRMGHHLVIMSRCVNAIPSYAPMYHLQFPYPNSKIPAELREITEQYADFRMVPTTAGRLRWLRCKRDLYQEEVAAYIDVNRATYANYEDDNRSSYPWDKLERLAGLYDVPVLDLMDEYNLFLYKGQGEQLTCIRHSLGMTQLQFAKMLGVARNTVIRWEQNQIIVSKSTWQKIKYLVEDNSPPINCSCE